MKESNDGNVVNMAEMRKRQKTTSRKGASNGKMSYEDAMKKTKGKSAQSNKFWIVLQFIIFMVLFAYVMSTCGGGV